MDEFRCPKCNSSHLTSNKKGFSGRNAAIGMAITGGVGLLAGTIGSNKVLITCLKCGFKFKAGDYQNELIKQNKLKKIEADNREKLIKNTLSNEKSFGLFIFLTILSIIGILLSFFLLKNEYYLLGIIFLIITTFLSILSISIINNESKKSRTQKKHTIENNTELKVYNYDNETIIVRNIGNTTIRDIIFTSCDKENEIKFADNIKIPICIQILKPRDTFEIKYKREENNINSIEITLQFQNEMNDTKVFKQIIHL